MLKSPWNFCVFRGPYGVIKEHVYGYGSDEYSISKLEESAEEDTPLVTVENYFKRTSGNIMQE